MSYLSQIGGGGTGGTTPPPPTSPPTVTSFTPASGLSGTVITVTGANFTGATAVTIGGVAAAFTVVSDTQITATALTTTGVIAVTTPAGTGTSATSFTVTAPAPTAPTISGFTPTSGQVGQVVTITGTNFSTATAVTIGGTAAAFTIVSATQITATAGSTSGAVTVTNPGGTATSTGTFTVSTPPVAPVPLYGFDETTPFPGYPSNAPFTAVQAKPWTPALQGASNFGTFTRDSSNGALKFDLTSTTSGSGSLDRAQAYYTKTLDENTTRVFSYEFLFPSRSVSMGGNYLITETGFMVYQTYGPPNLLYWVWNGGNPYVIFHMQTGELQPTSPVYEYNTVSGLGMGGQINNYVIPAADYVPDVWHQIVMAIYQRRTADGTVEIWQRQRGASTWTKRVNITGVKTIQVDGGVPPSTTVLDVVNAYRSHSPNAAFHYLQSWWRWSSVADAMAYLDGR